MRYGPPIKALPCHPAFLPVSCGPEHWEDWLGDVEWGHLSMVDVAMLATSAGAPTAGGSPGTPGLLREAAQMGGYNEDRELKGTVSQRESPASTQ